LKVLIACECSGIIRDAFRKKGHDTYSCDIKPDENNKSEFHIQDDILNHLDENWDLMIGHPVCTFLCRNRARQNRLEKRTLTDKDIQEGKSLFMTLLNANIKKICIENPVPSKVAALPQYDQIIQPYHYGHDHSKKTCLWLKNLPKLKPTKIVKITYITTSNGHKYTSGYYKTPRNSTDRSRTFTGIANAMADQWGS
tara:strand:+ start:611 stop:1201 length:591 start_codon:yes stop_codon:yes gene_type:complete